MFAKATVSAVPVETLLRARKLAVEQLDLALRNLRPNAILMPAFSAVICVIFRHWIETSRLVVWFSMVVITGLPLGLISFRFDSARKAAMSVRMRIRLSTLSYLVFTAAWAFIGLLLWAPGNDLNHMMVIMLLACTVAGNGALVGASRPLLAVSYAVYGAALVLAPLQSGGELYDAISLMAIIYVGYMAFMSRQIYLTARKMLLLRYEKNDLIRELERSKSESDMARVQAEAASRAKSQFLANMSHELRTPLNAILGFSEMITARVFPANSQKTFEYAELIHGSGAHLLTLINDILDLAKIEAGGWTLSETEVDLRAAIVNTCAMIRTRTDTAGCKLLVEAEADVPFIYCDERALKQILLNLLANAIKFTPRDGRVSVFAYRSDDGGVCFGVADTGVGIAAEDQQRVFQNFGQGRHDIVTADKGTGLGLPIVKGLIEAHGGSVELRSRVGEGTTVTVRLPPERVRADSDIRAAS